MSPIALPATERFFAPEITKCLYLPLIAASSLQRDAAGYLVPTNAEIDAGTDLSNEIADWAGWSVTSTFTPTPDLGSRYTGQITGRTTSEASTITFYADLSGDDVRTVLPRTTRGFILIADSGLGAAKLADVFPIEVGNVGKLRPVSDGSNQLTIGFAILRQPAEDIALPAAA